jgi:hypothetical protein
MATSCVSRWIGRTGPREWTASRRAWGLALAAMLLVAARAAPAQLPPHPYAKWAHGPSQREDFFPVAVWLQQPHNARRFQELGFNLYVGLWQGPTAEQLAALKAAGMPVICAQNSVGLTDNNSDMIVGWMHGDEPDNAQSLGEGKGYGPPIAPERVVADYRKLVLTDPSRPVLLNLGQGVAWDGWYGRGVRTDHPEDYAVYLEGCDIASFDIYPAVHEKEDVAGKLEFVARGVDRLREWGKGRRIVWNCIESTRIGNINVKPTPAQVRSEVWMALIHGSQGLIYFVHQFRPDFIEAGLLADVEMAKAVGEINRQIRELAPVLNSPTLPEAVSVTSSDALAPIDVLAKRGPEATYVFAVGMRNHPATATFRCKQMDAAIADVIGENRTLALAGGVFTDEFAPYAAHLYRLRRVVASD